MTAILKYQLSFMNDTLHNVPVAEPKLFAMQQGVPTLWFENGPKVKSANTHFRIFATGEPVPDGWQHYGSAIDGPYVWHVYGRPNA